MTDNRSRLFVILAVTVFCIAMLIPTVNYFRAASRLPTDATSEQRAELSRRLTDSKVISLGLDLQGGVDFLLAVDTNENTRRVLERDVETLRRRFREDNVNASVRLNAADNTILFKLNDVEGRNFAADILRDYANMFEFRNFTLETLGKTLTEDGVLAPSQTRLQQENESAFAGALQVVNKRVDALGLTNPEVRRQGTNRIRVRIPGQSDPDRVRETILRSAVLEFRLLHPDHDSIVQEFVVPGSWVPQMGTGVIRDEFLDRTINPESGKEIVTLKDSIPSIPAGYVLRSGTFRELDSATGAVIKETEHLAFILKEQRDITGDMLTSAEMFVMPSALDDPVQVSLEFNREGTRIFRDITTANVGRRFAILLDDVVFSAPNIREPIPNGRAQITGGFTQREAYDLTLVLKAGALKAPLEIIESSVIGPSLGTDSIRDSVKAIFYGSVFMIIFIVYVYRSAGVIACIAMVINVLMLLMALAMFGATLTLDGIAGLLLTMGMAVDANILIYERLREELRVKPPRAAITAAFNRVFGVILDSNITSLLPAVILISFEIISGGILGFWITLAIGLIANLYTGIVVTRALIEAHYEKTKKVSVGTVQLMQNVNVPWMKPYKPVLLISAGLVLASVLLLASGNLRLGIDFRGGLEAQVVVPESATSPLREFLEESFHEVQVVKVVNKENTYVVTLPSEEGEQTRTPLEVREDLNGALAAKYGGQSQVLSVQTIDSRISGEFLTSAVQMLFIAALVVLIYIAARFQWIFAVATVVGLACDLLLTMGVFTLLGKSFTMEIVSALMIILGYSVNDTIVVFDRIREELVGDPGADLATIFNRAINRTLSRTMFTGVTVLITLASLYFFGGAALSDFALTVIIGIVLGTASTVSVASMFAFVLFKRRESGGRPRPQKAATTRVTTLGATR